ncbi:TPR-like protein [Nadsonia fulvescens var. elongata DSM 6958]|uniref:TPR-like protein n=1 Tax=Nadsonia fulvescens var. elongata DSM 6958 TaxID=857566 RepID=A0A1E3PUL2_9ASCO|nr:TPR-like protein [Nadsonia fulvescens var. elongata DSM 6958]
MSLDPYALIAKADKKAAPISGFTSFFSSGSSYRFEEAADLYIQAANAFKIQKDSRSAGQTFEKAANTQLKSESKDDAANTLVEAYKAYRLTDPGDAVRVMEQAINMFTLRGQFRRAANYKMDLGAVYETDLSDYDAAIKAYEDAGEWYSQDQAEALSNKSFLKVAELAAGKADYYKAIQMFELVAKNSLNNSLTRWSLKDYFLKAGLCHLATNDTIGTEKAITQYIEWDASFQSTRECGLLFKLSEDIKAGDTEEFSNTVYEYDQFSKLDKWKTNVLLEIKNNIVNQEDDLL